MTEIESKAFARAGLLGNPSDGYGGKAISFVIRDFFAEVFLAESDNLDFKKSDDDRTQFDSLQQFSEHVDHRGFYGGLRLLKSTIYQFVNYCNAKGLDSSRPFSISYSSNIPRQVGLAGSSAIVVSALKALGRWNNVSIAPSILAALALKAEIELGISAGPQDRVVQSYGNLIYMDFSPESICIEDELRTGKYESLQSSSLKNIYIAFAADKAEPTEVLHNDLKIKFEQGDSQVVASLKQIAELASHGKSAIESADLEQLSRLIDRNFDLRRSICRLNPSHINMIEVARSTGASAKFCGSGGAIVGIFQDQQVWDRLSHSLKNLGCTVFQPRID